MVGQPTEAAHFVDELLSFQNDSGLGILVKFAHVN